MHEDLIGMLLDSVGADEAALITQLLLADGRCRLPDKWKGQFTGVDSTAAIAFYRSLDRPTAERFAAEATDPDVLEAVHRHERRASVRACLNTNPRLPEHVAEQILRGGKRLTVTARGALLARLPAERRIHAASALDWAKPTAVLGRAVAQHPSGPDDALSTALAHGGPGFAAVALRSAITCPVMTTISWSTVHAVVTAQPGFDPALDLAIGRHTEWNHMVRAVKFGHSLIRADPDGDQPWQDITWAETRAAGLRALGIARAIDAPSMRAAIEGVEHGQLGSLLAARWWFKQPMSVDDLQVLAGAGVDQPWKRHGNAAYDAGALRFLARSGGPDVKALTDLVSYSWESLEPEVRAELFGDPDLGPLIPAVLQRRPPSLEDMSVLLAAGVAPAALTSALFPKGASPATWTIRAAVGTDIQAAASLPAAILEARSNMTGPTWAQVLTARPTSDITGTMVYNAVRAHDHTEDSLNTLADLVIDVLDDIDAEVVATRILYDSTWITQKNGRRIMELIIGRPVVAEMLAMTTNKMIASASASLAFTPAALRLPLDWGHALGVGSPPALQAVLETVRTWYADDTDGLRAFLGLLPAWTGTLDDLRDAVGAVTG